MSDTEMIIEDRANCPFMFRPLEQEWRCQVRYFFAKTSSTKDRCVKRLCPLRKGKIIVIAKTGFDTVE
jgi:hypothetical protein